jgi:putative transposase
MSEATGRRRRRTHSEWQQLLEAQANSGLGPTAFCQANGVSLASFQQWKRKLADETPDESGTPWVELGTLAASSVSGWDIELQLGDGICLRLRRC